MVAERGWRQTSVQAVVREAGVPAHEFYDSFRSLEHCFVEVYDRLIERLARNAVRAVATRPLALGPAAWEDQLEAIIGSVLAFLAVEPALARTCIVEVLDAGPAARARRDEALGRFTSYVEGLRLTHGEPMPSLATEMIVLGTTDLIYRRVADGDADRLPTLLPELRKLWARLAAEALVTASG